MVSGRVGAVELIEKPVVGVQDEDVAITIAVRASFDGRIRRDGIGTAVALAIVLEGHRHPSLVSRYDHVGDAVRGAVPYGTEVRVQVAPVPMLAMN